VIYIRKIIYFIITSSFTLVVLLTLILFFYAAFFFKPPTIDRKATENQIIKIKVPPHIQSKKTLSKKVTKIDVPKIDAAIKDSLFVTVGNKAITQWDILNEIKIILILTGQSFTEDIKEQLQTGALESIISRTVKAIEIEKHSSLTFNPADLQNKVKTLASNLNMDVNTLENTFIVNGIPFSQVIDQIQVELLWNTLIFELYKNRLIVNIDEINEQLKSIQNKRIKGELRKIEEYLISEIIIKPVPKDKLESTIKEIKNRIKIDGFEKVAMNISISETALRGGNLDWISENSISEKFRSKIINTPIGNISEPILLPEGILLFKVRDKRKLKKFENLEDAKNQLVKAEKTKMLRMYSSSHYENVINSISINYH